MKKRVGIVQSIIGKGKKRLNLERALALASGKEVDFLVFPELFTTGYDLKEELAEDADGATVKTLSEFARTEKVNVIGGSIIERDGCRFYNTSYIFGRNGNVVASYSKRNLFRPLGEHHFFSSGNEKRNNENCACIEGVDVGLMICYDLRISRNLISLQKNSPQITFCPMEWPAVRTEIRNVFARARAAEGYTFVVCANATQYASRAPENLLRGESVIVDPSGEIILRGGEESALLVGEIELDETKKRRTFFEA